MADNPAFALLVVFLGQPGSANSVKIGGFNFVWCVRGGHGYDAH